jgi:hypothetical protein
MRFSEDNVRFQKNPPKSDDHGGWDILRADPTHPIPLTVVSSDFFGLRTHYHNGRTVPCIKDGCEACQAFKDSRWHGYLFAIKNNGHDRVIIEYTPPAHKQIEAGWKEHGTLRGLSIILSRTSNKANAKVSIAIRGLSPIAHRLPAEPFMWTTLAKIFGVAAVADPLDDNGVDVQLSEMEKARYESERPQTTALDITMTREARSLAALLKVPDTGNEHK